MVVVLFLGVLVVVVLLLVLLLLLLLIVMVMMTSMSNTTMMIRLDGAVAVVNDVDFQAQIEDGHGMAEHVSRSVRRLDAIQMRVQRALALVEDVINLRGCAEVGKRGGVIV